MQLVTGIFLTMNYKPSAEGAFASVEYIMRDVDWGWLIRYLHSTGASAFFIVVYLHMFRGLLYGSYKKPRELRLDHRHVDLSVPDGRSVLRLRAAVGQHVVLGRAGDRVVVRRDPGDRQRAGRSGSAATYCISDITLNRFFALHVSRCRSRSSLLVVVHIMALHAVGSNNPDGIEIKEHKGPDGHPLDGIAFHPYYTVKDLVGIVVSS